VELLKAALFGILQGLTEFLPVSSSGHLALFDRLLGYAPEGRGGFLFCVVAVHVATLFAVVIVFRREILSLFGSNRRVIGLLIIGTIPAGAFGFLIHDFFEQASSDLVLVGLGFLTTAFFLLAGRRTGKSKKDMASLTAGDSATIGFAQALAILPGISRSGSTIAIAQRRGVGSTAAARFSFLLMIPAVGGAALLDAREVLTGGGNCELLSVAVSFAAALVTALVALKLLLGLLKGGRFHYFSYYLIPLGILTALLGLFA
jgi:undecaprenyl-diphosphatase